MMHASFASAGVNPKILAKVGAAGPGLGPRAQGVQRHHKARAPGLPLSS